MMLLLAGAAEMVGFKVSYQEETMAKIMDSTRANPEKSQLFNG